MGYITTLKSAWPCKFTVDTSAGFWGVPVVAVDAANTALRTSGNQGDDSYAGTVFQADDNVQILSCGVTLPAGFNFVYNNIKLFLQIVRITAGATPNFTTDVGAPLSRLHDVYTDATGTFPAGHNVGTIIKVPFANYEYSLGAFERADYSTNGAKDFYFRGRVICEPVAPSSDTSRIDMVNIPTGYNGQDFPVNVFIKTISNLTLKTY